MSLKLKNFGLLEFIIIISAVYVVGMLIWTASTRPEVEARANLVKENHKKVVDFINGEINNCGNNDEGKITAWGDPCNAEWIAEKVVNHINDNLKIIIYMINNLFSYPFSITWITPSCYFTFIIISAIINFAINKIDNFFMIFFY